MTAFCVRVVLSVYCALQPLLAAEASAAEGSCVVPDRSDGASLLQMRINSSSAKTVLHVEQYGDQHTTDHATFSNSTAAALPSQPDVAIESCVPPGMRKVPVGDLQMVVLHHDIVSDSLARDGHWEISSPRDMVTPAAAAGGLFPQRGTFLDIGANLGYYSLLFAKQGYNVVAVEPMTRNRHAIEGSLCLNPQLRSRITVVPAALVALDDAATTSCIIRSTNDDINIGNGQLKCGNASQTCAAGDQNCEKVPVKTLDSVLAELKLQSVDVVKMDVEHYECHVFRGGQSLFQKYRPQYLQVETTAPETSSCVQDEARKFGYSVFPSGDNSLLAKQTQNTSAVRTLLALLQH